MDLGTIGNFALNYVIAAYRAVFAWFGALLDSIGLYEFVVCLILFVIAFGLLIMPFRGRMGISPLAVGASDLASHRRQAASDRARAEREAERESYEYYSRNRSRNEAYARRYREERRGR